MKFREPLGNALKTYSFPRTGRPRKTMGVTLSGKNLKTCLQIHRGAHSRCSYSTVFKVLSRSTQERKALKVGKEVNVSPFADNIILFLKDLIESTRNFLYLINNFYSVIRYKANMQKPGALLHSTNEAIKKEERKQLYL